MCEIKYLFFLLFGKRFFERFLAVLWRIDSDQHKMARNGTKMYDF